MEQILLANSFTKETVTAIMMLYKNTKEQFCSPDGDTDFFHIVSGVLQKDTLVPYPFIICQDYVLQTPIDLIKENGFTLKKKSQKSTILHTNYYGHRLCRWHSTFFKCTNQSQIPAA